jgi:hypothetical protein
MKKISFLFFVFVFHYTFTTAQTFEDSINEEEISATLKWLASDSLKGRGNFTPELVKAATYISDQFRNYGLSPFPGYLNFHQPFNGATSKTIYRDQVEWNGIFLDQSQFIYISPEILPTNKTLAEFHIVEYNGDFGDSIFLAHWSDTTNTLIIWKNNPSPKQRIQLDKFQHPGFPPIANILFVSQHDLAKSIKVFVNEQYRKNILFNVIGMLQGKSKPNEVVIFSAHYDHIGSIKGYHDTIFNGANDDASGVTAVLALAKYFSLKADNKRTIFFCAFAGEELGLLGSTYLASLLRANQVVTVINIEMIGKTMAAGDNSFIVTGSQYSDLKFILEKNLKNDELKVYSNESNLFKRSDNYPFALKGIPAHTIMCSDDDDECYHEACDDFQGINISNMTRIIRAIAKASQSIISGDDTPRRIVIEEVKKR